MMHISSARSLHRCKIGLVKRHLCSLKNMSSPMDQIKNVDIDTGRFKYILIKIIDKETSKFIVRGHTWASYHANIFDRIEPDIKKLGLKCECVGGGRILHNENEKTVKVFGYSQGFGRADHKVAVELIKKDFKDYQITWSNSGY